MKSPRLLPALLSCLLAAGCGGGRDGDDSADGTVTSASANGVIVADDSVRAQSVVLTTARTVISVGGASQIVSCAGGGSAAFTASGSQPRNGTLDAGEVYSIEFFGCRSSSGSARVTGDLTLTVLSASGPDHTVATESDVTVELPRRTLNFDGTSTLLHTETTSGTTQVVTDQWVSSSVRARSLRNGRYTELSLSNVNLTRRVTTTNGEVTDISENGSITMAYDGWAGDWSATVSTDGVVRFDIDGVPIAGLWRIALPHNLVALQVLGSAVRVTQTVGAALLWPIVFLINAAD